MSKLERAAPEVPVLNLRSAVEYYEARLGFRKVMQMPDGAYAIVERDRVAIHLFEEGKHRHSPVSLHIYSDGLDELHEELQKRGAKLSQGIESKPWGTRDFRAVDDSGNEIKFTEPRAEA